MKKKSPLTNNLLFRATEEQYWRLGSYGLGGKGLNLNTCQAVTNRQKIAEQGAALESHSAALREIQ